MFKDLIAALLTVCPRVNRYEAAKREPPYIVWQEAGPGETIYAGNKHKHDVIIGSIDYFSKEENDSIFTDMRTALNDVPNLTWSYESTQFDTVTKIINHEWSFQLRY